MHPVRVRLVGPVLVRHAEDEWRAPASVRLRSVLAVLAMAEDRPVSRDALFDAVWGDQAGVGIGALHAAVARLRVWLQDCADGELRITHGPAGYLFEAPGSDVDVHRVRALRTRAEALTDPARRLPLLEEALRLADADLATDLEDHVRAELRAGEWADRRAELVIAYGRAARAAGEAGRALADLEESAATRPYDEPLHAELIISLASVGRQADGVAAFQRVRTALTRELGVNPSPQLMRAYQRMLEQEITVSAEPVAPTTPRWRGPRSPLDGLIGREDDLAGVASRLAAHSLVTVVGAAGAGKTALVLEVAARVGDPVISLVLTSCRCREDVMSVVGSTLGISGETTGEIENAVLTALGAHQGLIVIDNAEHLIDIVAGLVDQLRDQAPRVRLLVTSRQPLGVPAESVYALTPLPVPPGGATVDPDCPSVVLFLRRAREAATNPDLDDLVAVGRICRQVDGLPLALELAAARVRAFSVSQLADRLEGSLGVLTGARRSRDERHATLDAAIAWSFQLLDPAEAALLTRLAVFRAGFTVEAAEQVCAAADLPTGRIAGLLAELVDKSLVSPYDEGGRRRYRLLEAVRAFAEDRCVAGAELRAAHLRYWARVVNETFINKSYSERYEPARSLAPELPNVRAALEGGARMNEWVTVARIVLGLYDFWLNNPTYAVEGEQWLDRLATIDSLPARLRAELDAMTAFFLLAREDFLGARTRAERALPELAAHSSADYVEALTMVVVATRHLVDPVVLEDCSTLIEAALTWGDADQLANAHTLAAAATLQWDQLEDAEFHLDEYRRHQYGRGRTLSGRHLELAAMLAGCRGDHEASMELLARSAREVGDNFRHQQQHLLNRVLLLMANGRDDQALVMARESIKKIQSRHPGRYARVGALRVYLAEAERRCGDPATARVELGEALESLLMTSNYLAGSRAVLVAALLADQYGDRAATVELSASWYRLMAAVRLPVPPCFRKVIGRLPKPRTGLDASIGWSPSEFVSLMGDAHDWCLRHPRRLETA